MGVSKNMKEASALIDKAAVYSITDAVGLIKSISKAKFDGFKSFIKYLVPEVAPKINL